MDDDVPDVEAFADAHADLHRVSSLVAPRDNMAVDGDGNPLPHSPEAVRAIVLKMINEGEILAVIVRNPAGDLGVQVFGPPSRELLRVLETTTAAYRRVLKGHA